MHNRKMRISFPGGGGGGEPLGDRGQSDQLPSLHHQGDEQERRRRHRSGQEEGWDSDMRLNVTAETSTWHGGINTEDRYREH